MPTPIETSLITLVPTLNSLPDELVDLATSLLAQSRAKAANLRPEEEIGRTFVVCHLACERWVILCLTAFVCVFKSCLTNRVYRLKQKLAIEKINARPPVPPRIYKKLYAYLDSALVKQATTPRTPRHRDAVALSNATSATGTPASVRTRAAGLAAALGNTPTKTPTSVFKGSGGPGSAPGSVASGGRRSTRLPPKTIDALPSSTSKLSLKDTVQPHRLLEKATVIEHDITNTSNVETPKEANVNLMVKAICDEFDMPHAEPHVLAGCSTVLAARGWNPDRSESQSPALTRKRTRHSIAGPPASTEEPEEEEERGRKRRRTGNFTHTNIQPAISSEDGFEGEITPITLPPMIIALALYTIFTLQGSPVSGHEYNDARDSCIAALRKSSCDGLENEQTVQKGVAAFLKAAHVEAWLEMPWADQVKEMAKSMHGHEDVEMHDADATEEQTQEGAEDGSLLPSQEEEEELIQRTPRKPTKPAKTPLRRREKHAPRPAPSKDKDKEEVEEDGLGRAGLRSGLGTMFQDAVDWLSMDRCEEHENWEDWIRKEIGRIESEDGVAAA